MRSHSAGGGGNAALEWQGWTGGDRRGGLRRETPGCARGSKGEGGEDLTWAREISKQKRRDGSKFEREQFLGGYSTGSCKCGMRICEPVRAEITGSEPGHSRSPRESPHMTGLKGPPSGKARPR